MADSNASNAESDMVKAINAVNAMSGAVAVPTVAAGDIGGQTLPPGLYYSGSTIGITGAVTLDAGGATTACFIFQVGSAMTTATSSSVVLAHGAQASNVFWAVGTDVTLGMGTAFQGNIMALGSITFVTGASLTDGRALCGSALTFAGDNITSP